MDGPDAGSAPPLVVLIDFDGTIARSDVSDEVMYRFADRSAWAPLEAAYLRGEIGSRTLLTEQAALLHGDMTEVASIGDEEQLDPHFVPFVADMQARSVPIEVVSDGFGFFVRPALARLGLADLPVFSARTTFEDDAARISFPDGHPTCRVCGTCKRDRILRHQAAGSFVVFVGDGFSDLYAAGHADRVYAKDHLAELCTGQGWPFRPWATFADIRAEIVELLTTGVPATRMRPFICGPEAWPAGTSEPIWERPPAARTAASGR
ncbi:MAG: 2-hydroxy-3-keto-5-methylthiopentenyl-phosphate phosphatase [Chloroflexota bacterium]|jgi:HAD superfamily phosphoserine phosphatase-like hydrolase|nr:2-hydroxy-3-keto-5-methylthiopentenyl-phosphate phosphatase [Chloroflexota bacterium]